MASTTKQNILVLDTEASTFAKGNPFSLRNKLMCVGTYAPDVYPKYHYFDIEHSGMPYDDRLRAVNQNLTQTNLLIGFNIKYDLHWLRRYIPSGLTIPRVWDCQLAQFILNDQTTPYPSLDECLSQYGLPLKLDQVKRDYWDKGIDTDQVPQQILKDYNEQDCISTYRLYQRQKDLLSGNRLRLFELHCADLLVLQEMEFRGLLFRADQSKIEGSKVEIELTQCIKELNSIVGTTNVNWNSPAHISAILYGGNLKVAGKEQVEKTRKDGSIRAYERACVIEHPYPRLVDPLEGTETTHGWSTAEDTLRSLDCPASNSKAFNIIQLVLKVSKLDKLVGTYYNGLPELITKMDWELDTLHGQINQCVARTGRTSSSQPNLQNFDPRLKPLIYSSFE